MRFALFAFEGPAAPAALALDAAPAPPSASRRPPAWTTEHPRYTAAGEHAKRSRFEAARGLRIRRSHTR